MSQRVQEQRPAQALGPTLDERVLLRAPRRAAPRRALDAPWLLPVGHGLLVCGALLLWFTALRGLDIRRMGDLGLASILPPAAYLAPLALTASFCAAIGRKRLNTPVLLGHLLASVFMLHGAVSLFELTPRFEPALRHVGIADYIARYGAVDTRIDAYFSWPGFFILTAFLAEVAGLPDTLGFVSWAPVLFNVLYLGPLYMILRAVTRDRRVIWIALWLFPITNWIYQDYFSPQALNFFLFLTIVAVLLTYFKRAASRSFPREEWGQARPAHRLLIRLRAWLAPGDLPNRPSRPGQRAALLVILMAIYGAIVPSHQLTPFFALAAVGVLVVFRRVEAWELLLFMGVVTAAWLTFMTTGFLEGHKGMVTGQIGQVGAIVSANVTNRLQGSAEHLFVVRMRLVMTVAVWLLACLGGLWRLRQGFRDVNYALLAVAPFPLLILQPYGGEMLLRIYLFALPFMIFFAASLFRPARDGEARWYRAAALGLVSLLLLGGFLFARYGNERMNYFTPGEVAAVRALSRIAEPGAQVLAVGANLPWKVQDYEKYRYNTVLGNPAFLGDPALRERLAEAEGVALIAAIMRDSEYPSSYLILTRSQAARAELLGELPPGVLGRLEEALAASSEFRTVYAGDDARIFTLER
jgi:hypothetical protein